MFGYNLQEKKELRLNNSSYYFGVFYDNISETSIFFSYSLNGLGLIDFILVNK